MIEIVLYTAFFVYCLSYIYYCYTVVLMVYQLANKHISKKIVYINTMLLFCLNVSYFGTCSALGLGLLKNFALFWIVFYIEERFLFKVDNETAKFLTLYITLCTLSSILFYYGAISIVINKPLAYFYNVFEPMDFRKIYALSLSYFSSAIVFRRYRNENKAAPLRHLISSMNQMKFMVISMVVMFIYLLFQGIMYGILDNSMEVKVWNLSVCIYISIGFKFALTYAIKLSYFYRLDKRNLQLQNTLELQNKNVSNLTGVADIDTLTKVRNRSSGIDSILKFMENGQDFVLCLVDLDSLKYVNDYIGHQSGDDYLINVVEIMKNNCRFGKDIICRYGGDEFLIAYSGLSYDEAYKNIETISALIKQQGDIKKLPMCISFGIEAWDKECSFETLFENVDKKMYAMKQEHKKQSPQFMRK